MPKRLALFIGNSTYDDATLTRLKAPAADVRSLAAALRDPGIGEFDQVQELIDQSESIVRRAIADFFTRRHPDDLLLFFFSGHGVKDDRGRLYLAVRDTDYHQLSATAISSGFVVEHMDECRSKRQILILDCCNSGAFARGVKGDPTAVTADMFAGNGYGRVVLTASDATQYALEGDRVIERAELSLFTHYLLEGLVTGAASSEDTITLDALYDYAYGKIVSSTPSQTPRKWVYNQQGMLVIARNPRRQHSLPVSLPSGVRHQLEDTQAAVRLTAVRELERLLVSPDASVAVAARTALQRIADADRSKQVRQAAEDVLRASPLSVRPSSAAAPPAGPLVPPAAAAVAPATGTTAELASSPAPNMLSGAGPAAAQTATPPHGTGAAIQPGPAGRPLADSLAALPSAKQISESLSRLPVNDWLTRLGPRGEWVAANALAFAASGFITGGLLRFAQWNLASRFVGGLVEGVLLGLATLLFLRKRSVPPAAQLWMGAIIAACILRWQIPVQSSKNIWGVVHVSNGAAFMKGVLDGVILGLAQTWAARVRGVGRLAWVFMNVVGWGFAYLWFVGATQAFLPTLIRAPMVPAIVIGAVSGLLIGAATALALPLFAPSPPITPGVTTRARTG